MGVHFSQVNQPMRNGPHFHDASIPVIHGSCLSILCIIFHLCMKVMDNADMFKPKLIIFRALSRHRKELAKRFAAVLLTL